MKTDLRCAMWGAVLVCVCSTLVFSQQNSSPASASGTIAAPQLPRLVKFSGTLKDINGSPLTTITGVTFALYSQQNGGAPLWLETQNVQPDRSGRYTVMLGSTKVDGLETELFVSEMAQWLGIRPQGQEEQPRVLLVSVPYALKAGDAETLGGKPASAFMPANPVASASSAAMAANSSNPAGSNRNLTPSGALTGAGTANFIPKWTTGSTLGNSKIFQSTSGNVGIGTTTPTAMLDVSGTSFLSGNSGSTFALTVYSPAQLAEVVEGPVSGVGAGLDLKTTGTGGKQWEILATGNAASQGVGKFNIRDVTTSTDALTIDATDTVNVKNLSANSQTLNGSLTASSGILTINATTTSTSDAAVGGTGSLYGVVGLGKSSSGSGVSGYEAAPSGTAYGVYGLSASSSGYGVYGSSPYIGAGGYSSSTSGYNIGVYGASASPNGFGVYGTGKNIAIYGFATKMGVYGTGGGSTLVGEGLGLNGVWGVWGDSAGGSGPSAGVLGTAQDNYAGYFANQGATSTLFIKNEDGNFGDEAFVAYLDDVNAYATIGDPGCNVGFIALQLGFGGMSNCNNYTITGGVNGHTYVNASSGSAVHLRVSNVDILQAASGSVNITGSLNATGTKNFRIDHPLDPANKYLVHAAIESSEVLNLYSGNAILDASGEAVVQLPDWFEVINKDFRYQLTSIGAPGRDLYVAAEVSGGHFKIAGGQPGGKVSWQVSGVRNDAWVKAHPMEVEVDKGADRGHYLAPELVGAPETARIGYMAPAPGSERIVHRRPPVQKRVNVSPLQMMTPPSTRALVPMPIALKVPVMPHPVAPVAKWAASQK